MTMQKPPAQEGTPDRVNLADLLLDAENPRFGELERGLEQRDLLNLIVTKFGVEDVLSSIAINGFFSAEPLICKPNGDGRYVVIEGNRRLSACLIITQDERANGQELLRKRYGDLWAQHGTPRIEPLPVIIFDDEKQTGDELLSYLGVRHIASAQPWDSYAKASWVAKVTSGTSLSVGEVASMIGDQHGTVLRLLEGYNFIRQLIDVGAFVPENSLRKGRGSVTDYPFSWVYTILGYKAARNFVGLGEIAGNTQPIHPDKLDNAALMVSAMFGDRALGRNSAVTDSRQLIALAKILADPDKVALIRAGRDVETVEELTKPIEQRLEDNLNSVRDLLSNLLTGLAETPPKQTTAAQFLSLARKNRGLASDVDRRLQDLASGDED